MGFWISAAIVAVLACCTHAYYYPGSPYDGIRPKPRPTFVYPTGTPEPLADHKFHNRLYYHANSHYMTSCRDHYHPNATNGFYRIYSAVAVKSMMVYCDFTTEPGTAYTLVMSSDQASRDAFQPVDVTNKLTRTLAQFKDVLDSAVNVDHPNFNSFRLPLADMQRIYTATSHWRLTCIKLKDGTLQKDMDLDGSIYSKYIRGRQVATDLFGFTSPGQCKSVEYARFEGVVDGSAGGTPGPVSCSNCQVRLAQGGANNEFALHVEADGSCLSAGGAGSGETQFKSGDGSCEGVGEFLQLWFGKAY